MQNVKVKRNGRQAETECLQHFCYGTISAAHATRRERLARQRVSRQQRANARIGAIDDSSESGDVAGTRCRPFPRVKICSCLRAYAPRTDDPSTDENSFQLDCCWRRQPARNGVLRKYEIGVAEDCWSGD